MTLAGFKHKKTTLNWQVFKCKWVLGQETGSFHLLLMWGRGGSWVIKSSLSHILYWEDDVTTAHSQLQTARADNGVGILHRGAKSQNSGQGPWFILWWCDIWGKWFLHENQVMWFFKATCSLKAFNWDKNSAKPYNIVYSGFLWVCLF